MPFVEVTGLRKYFPVQRGFLENALSRKHEFVRAVDDVEFSIEKGETFGLVGESGSGKTTTGRLLLRLIEATSGKIIIDGKDIVKAHPNELRDFRRQAQMIFQDPTAALSPRMTVGEAIKDALDIHQIGPSNARKETVLQILGRVGLTPPELFYDKYPHQLSGGQRQRAVIGRTMILEPHLIVADEPVAMVDVSVRAQILDLLSSLKKDLGLTYVFITHDLATANYFCDRIAIMYLGRIVEVGLRDEVFNSPKHPYAVALMSAIPVPDPQHKRQRMIPRGEIPSPINPPSGCRFHPRCPKAFDPCATKDPGMIEINRTHRVACHLFDAE
ncbi:MAG: ABC transporter ATP-binding protein [Candidatus Bathyarchaeia archaeon]